MAILTVRGIIDKKDLGITLPHEHIYFDSSLRYNRYKISKNHAENKYETEKVKIENLYLLKNDLGFLKDNLYFEDEEISIKELSMFKDYGGNSIIDQTSIGVSLERSRIKNISEMTRINIIAGTGFYLKESLPKEIVDSSSEDLLKIIIEEFDKGIEGKGARAGIIGELGIGPEIGRWEEKLLKASAKAQKVTGLAISVHIQAVPNVPDFKGGLNGLEALKMLEAEGANPEKIAICHVDAKIDLKYILEIVKIGAFVEFDHMGKDFYFSKTDFSMDRDLDRVSAIKGLLDKGHINKILVSQDICLKTDLIRYGGYGYAHVLRDIVPMMKNKGITESEIKKIMVENPANLIDIEDKYL